MNAGEEGRLYVICRKARRKETTMNIDGWITLRWILER
jgi:hypothetical protein